MNKTAGLNQGRPLERLPGRKDYLSFFLLQVSQVLPAFLASTQHLCVQSLPASLAFSQQLFSALSAARAPAVNMAKAQRIEAIDFICFPFLPPDLQAAAHLFFVDPTTRSKRLSPVFCGAVRGEL